MKTARATAGYSRFSSYLLIVPLAAAGVAGCAGMAATTTQLPLITLGIEEPARWIESRDVPRYQCAEDVLLVCTSGEGRLSTRLCRCVPQVGAGGSASPHHE